jgi:hypothetical protein
MSTNARNQPRQPKGAPAAGQWRPASRADGPALKAGRPTLADFLDAGDPIFPAPDHVGSPEYRAIYDLLSDILDGLDDPGPGEAPQARATDALAACLVEVEDWASTLRKRLRLSTRSA